METSTHTPIPAPHEPGKPELAGGKQKSAFGNAREMWGESAMDAGFQVIPDVLFRCQEKLKLEATDVVILLNIAMHWWSRDDLPHPRPSVIAKRMDISTRTVERRLTLLQEKGLLQRLPAQQKKGKSVRLYDLQGLVQRLNEFGRGNLALRRAGAVAERNSPPTMEAPWASMDAPF